MLRNTWRNHDYCFGCQPELRRAEPVHPRQPEIHGRELLRRHRRQRRGEIHLPENPGGELEPSTGEVAIDPKTRMSVLKQDHYAYDEYTVLDAIILGNPRLYEIMKQKDALYAKEDFTEEDGVLASELEGEFAELNGWEAETEAGRILQGLGLDTSLLESPMAAVADKEKVKILLAQALFGQPDIILLDEPTNHLDIASIRWLEDFLMDYIGTVIVVSHDRHFLNNVCTHIVDVDYNKIKIYVGNYDFWYESSQLMQRMMKDQNKRTKKNQGTAELY